MGGGWEGEGREGGGGGDGVAAGDPVRIFRSFFVITVHGFLLVNKRESNYLASFLTQLLFSPPFSAGLVNQSARSLHCSLKAVFQRPVTGD